MRAWLAAAFLGLAISAPARAAPPKLAVFDFELLDTGLQGEMNGPGKDEQERLMRASDQLRKELAASGKFRTGRIVTAMNANLRGNNDESWSRATSYLVRNRLLAPNYGVPRPQ